MKERGVNRQRESVREIERKRKRHTEWWGGGYSEFCESDKQRYWIERRGER